MSLKVEGFPLSFVYIFTCPVYFNQQALIPSHLTIYSPLLSCIKYLYYSRVWAGSLEDVYPKSRAYSPAFCHHKNYTWAYDYLFTESLFPITNLECELEWRFATWYKFALFDYLTMDQRNVLQVQDSWQNNNYWVLLRLLFTTAMLLWLQRYQDYKRATHLEERGSNPDLSVVTGLQASGVENIDK